MEHSSFFNSINGDRKYKASDFAEFFNSFITNGVFPNPSTGCQVIGTNNNMTVTFKAGKGWINGYQYYNDSDLILPIDVADGVLNRVDRIVLRMDTDGRAITAQVKKGTFASSPVAPSLQRDADGYELGIADVYVAAGATSITQSNVTDLRLNSDMCGIVDFVKPIDTKAIFDQYQNWYNQKTGQYQTDMSAKESDFSSQFNTWFAGIKNTLGTDAAGNLLNKVNDLAGDGRTTETVKENADNIAALTKTVDSHSTENASTTQKGHVQLYDGTDSTSTVLAATANSVKIAMDKADSAFQSANDGKTAVANAVTAKGVSANASDTFSTLATKIGQINTGKKWASGVLTITKSDTLTQISGLSFTPEFIAVEVTSSNDSRKARFSYVAPSEYFSGWDINDNYIDFETTNVNEQYGTRQYPHMWTINNGSFSFRQSIISGSAKWIAIE